jgi:predicted transposase YbfD/YdcC
MKSEEQRGREVRSLIECLEQLDDPRVARTREHKLVDIMVIGICAIITVGENFTDMESFAHIRYDWLKSFLELPGGVPSHDTFNRVFSAIDPQKFTECFVRWTQGVCTVLEGQVVAIDGKSLRRSADAGHSAPCIVSAWAAESNLTLGQVKVDKKSNEITAIPELLDTLALKGCIVSIDAMGCQKKIAAKIADSGAHYLLALKANHGTAYQEFKEYFDHFVAPEAKPDKNTPEGMSFHRTIDKGHGRIETRRYWHTDDIDWFEDKHLWKKLRSVMMVESIRETKEKRSIKRRYFITSLTPDAKQFGPAIRTHWGIENPLHWTLDVTFGEDQSRARTKHAAQNLALLRRISLNLLKLDKTKDLPMRRKRMAAALEHDYLLTLLGILDA